MEKKEFIENEKIAFSNQMDPECEEQKNMTLDKEEFLNGNKSK